MLNIPESFPLATSTVQVSIAAYHFYPLKLEWLKTKNNYLTILEKQEFVYSSAGSLWISVSPMRTQSSCQTGLCSHLSGASSPKLTHVVAGLPWTSACGPPHRAVHSMAACFPQSKQSKWERTRKGPQDGSHSLLIIVSGVISHYFCQILFIRYESLNPVYTQAEGITQRHDTRRWDHLCPP